MFKMFFAFCLLSALPSIGRAQYIDCFSTGTLACPVDFQFNLDGNGAVAKLVGGWTSADIAGSDLPSTAPAIFVAMKQISLPIGTVWYINKYQGTYSSSCGNSLTYWWPASNGDPTGLAHEMALAMFDPCSVNSGDQSGALPEGQAHAKAFRVVTKLYGSVETGLPMLSTKQAQRFFASGGGFSFKDGNGVDREAIGALFETFSEKLGGTFIPIDRLWAQVPADGSGIYYDLLLSAIDQAVGPVNGTMPSTWIKNLPNTFGLSTDQRTALGWTADSDPTNGIQLEAYVSAGNQYYEDVVNPCCANVLLCQRYAGTTLVPASPHIVKFSISDSSGTELSETTFTVIGEMGGTLIWNVKTPNTQGVPLPTKDGVYLTNFCLFDTGVCDAKQVVKGKFLVDNSGWASGKNLVVMAPNAKLDLVATQRSLYSLTYIGAHTDVVVIGNLPSVYTEVSLTDGNVVRSFSYDPDVTGNLADWQPFDDPNLLSIVDVATLQPTSQVSPNSWLTLYTIGASHGDPDFTKSVNGGFPTVAGVGPLGQTKLAFSLNGTELLGAMNYASTSQVNVQVPPVPSSWIGQTVNVQVDLNGTRSNVGQIEIIPTKPAIFMIDPTQSVGAVINALTGQVIDATNPAHAGDLLSVYYTGCGPLSENVPVGQPAPTDHIVYATSPTEILVGGVSTPVLFNGLAGGFVGLCQLNLFVPSPAGMSSVSSNFTSHTNPTNTINAQLELTEGSVAANVPVLVVAR